MRVYKHREGIRRRTVAREGRGLVNTLINKLPIELHIPGYSFCGPGTKLQKRLARGDQGINPLDEACKEHDIAYSQYQDLHKRHEADSTLAKKAWERVRSKDAGIGEKAAAVAITGIMKGKTKLGMGGLRKRRRSARRGGRKRLGGAISFTGAVTRARNRIKGKKGYDLLKAAQMALSSIKKKKINEPKTRIIKIPKTGGILPLIPIFAALSALGSLGGGAAAVAKAVGDAKAAAKDLKEKERHNKAMEAVALGKGLYLKPYRRGFGLYLRPYQPSYQQPYQPPSYRPKN